MHGFASKCCRIQPQNSYRSHVENSHTLVFQIFNSNSLLRYDNVIKVWQGFSPLAVQAVWLNIFNYCEMYVLGGRRSSNHWGHGVYICIRISLVNIQKKKTCNGYLQIIYSFVNSFIFDVNSFVNWIARKCLRGLSNNGLFSPKNKW